MIQAALSTPQAATATKVAKANTIIVLDPRALPYIFDRILACASYTALLRLRATCRDLRNRADMRLMSHLRLEGASLMPVLTASGKRVPLLSRSALRSHPRQAQFVQLLRESRAIDYTGSFRPVAKLLWGEGMQRWPKVARAWVNTELRNRLPPASHDTLVYFVWSSLASPGDLPRPIRALPSSLKSVVLNLSIDLTDMFTAPNSLRLLECTSRTLENLVVVFHPSAADLSNQRPPSNLAMIIIVQRLFGFLWRRAAHGHILRIIMVDTHLLPVQVKHQLTSLLRLTLSRDLVSSPRLTQQPTSSRPSNRIEKSTLKARIPLPKNAITLLSSTVYRTQIGDERFRLYTDASFVLI
ncbi:unnamed protein product [Cutaneotrichosporon oleaginosum]